MHIRPRINGIAESVEFFKCDVPFPRKNVGSELSPVAGDEEVGVGGKNGEMVEVIGCARVVAVCVLELSKSVMGGNLGRC